MFFAVTVLPATSTVRVLEAGVALDPVDLVLLEQELDAAGQALHRVEALGLHGAEVQLGRNLDAHRRHRTVLRCVEVFRRVEQGLRGDAAHVEASAAQRLAPFGTGGLEAELRSADRRDVAAGAGTDDKDVVIVISHCWPPGARASTSSA
jgi:hypothetical protein